MSRNYFASPQFCPSLSCSPFAFLRNRKPENDAASVFKANVGADGVTGDGNTAVGKGMNLRDLRSPDVQKQTDAELYKIICCGKGKMPGYQGKLTDDQIKQQVAYLRSLSKQ